MFYPQKCPRKLLHALGAPRTELFRPLPVVEVEPRDAADVTEAFVYAEWLVGRLKVLPKKGDLSVWGRRRKHNESEGRNTVK